jgi:hypothetical protein
MRGGKEVIDPRARETVTDYYIYYIFTPHRVSNAREDPDLMAGQYSTGAKQAIEAAVLFSKLTLHESMPCFFVSRHDGQWRHHKLLAGQQ